ncbi:hypothetical protein AV530_009981 [Patagioenas fasciata monilis]|uniref:Uncharacterized protein n=1 Tax=Patagioenas fasciata monilis TaxID=372326 RepID=A0A1V4KAR2_PATFA|nr:hypothetical protein AV530_009981 [Patagioenas fasciata monilis]
MFSPSIQDQVGHIPYHVQLNFVPVETNFQIFKQLKAEWKVCPKPSKEPQGCEKSPPQITEDSLALRKKEAKQGAALATTFASVTVEQATWKSYWQLFGDKPAPRSDSSGCLAVFEYTRTKNDGTVQAAGFIATLDL